MTYIKYILTFLLLVSLIILGVQGNLAVRNKENNNYQIPSDAILKNNKSRHISREEMVQSDKIIDYATVKNDSANQSIINYFKINDIYPYKVKY